MMRKIAKITASRPGVQVTVVVRASRPGWPADDMARIFQGLADDTVSGQLRGENDSTARYGGPVGR